MADAKELLAGVARVISGNEEELDRIASPDIDFKDSMQEAKGIEELRAYLHSWNVAFPDAQTELKNILSAGDQAAGELVYTGTQTGPMAGPQGEIPPTGKTVKLLGSCWVTISGDKVSSFRGYFDTMQMMIQLGLMPAPAQA